MIFDEEIIEEKYDPRKLPSMIPSYHNDKRLQEKLNGDQIILESQEITLGNKVVQSEFKIDSCNPYDQKTSEHTHITENEEQAPFNYMLKYQHPPPFSFKRSKYHDDQDSKQVEVLQSYSEKYAQGVRSMKVNQNILQSINLAQSQTFYNCMLCFHHHQDQTNQFEKNFHPRESESLPFNSKRGSCNNTEKLLDKLRLRSSSQINQGPLNPFMKGNYNNTSQIYGSNQTQLCLCSCHSTTQGHGTYHNHHSSGISSSKSHGFRKFHQKFHSSIIDSSQFMQNNSPTQVRDTSLSNQSNIKRVISHNNISHQHNNIRYRQKRAKSMIEIIDNPEIRKKWALTRVLQMNFDAQLTHTLIQSIDYFNLSKEQILDQIIDKLLEFKKYRQQQQLEGSLIQPQISHSDFLKQQQSIKVQKPNVRNDSANYFPQHFQKQSQFFIFNNNQNNYEDMSISLPRGNEYGYGRNNGGYVHMYAKHQSQSPTPHESIQNSIGLGRNHNINFNHSGHLNGNGDSIRYAVSPTRSRNNYNTPSQKRQAPKYNNFSHAKLSQSNSLYAPIDRTKIRKRSQILQQKFKQETKQGICSVCLEEVLLIQISSRCHHYFCSFCITNYFEEKIAKCDVLEINCLNFQCSNKYTEPEVREVVDSSTFQQYLKFKRLIMIRQDQSLRWCITLDCNGVLKGSTQNPKMQCPICQTFQCFICSGAWHEGRRCDQAINEEYEKEQLELRKNCPKCFKQVKKSKKCINKSTCRACGHRFCWLCNRKVTPFHFSTWNFFGCPGMININQIPSYYQKMKYKIKALFEYIAQLFIFSILLILYPIVMLIGSFFLPLLIFFNKNGGTVRYRGYRKFLAVTGLIALGIIFYPLWYIISIVPGSCWFCKELGQYLRNQKENSKNQESEDDLDDDFDIFSQQVTKGNNESGITKNI